MTISNETVEKMGTAHATIDAAEKALEAIFDALETDGLDVLPEALIASNALDNIRDALRAVSRKALTE